MSFTHLRTHTAYSIVDGMMTPKEVVEKAKDMGMSSVAITDLDGMFGVVKFYKAAKDAGIKPIIGVELRMAGDDDLPEESRIVLIARNNEGYRELMELTSLGYTQGLDKKKGPLAPREQLLAAGKSGNLIALSGGIDGDIGKSILEKDPQAARRYAEQWQEAFGDRFYIELTRTGRKREDNYTTEAVDIALDLDIPVVATNDNRFLKKEQFENHEIRVCIMESMILDERGYRTPYSPHQWFKPAEDMEALFADIPEAIENANEIANRCNVEITLGEDALPRFPTEGGMSESEYLRKMSEEGLRERLNKIFADKSGNERTEVEKPYWERLETELGVINEMGFPGYFLIVADFIQWSKNNGVPVGPGRGSGAGSIVAYACKITDIDPLPYDLLFERFLNPERVSMPDFDVDFCIEGRDRVIDYVAGFYGREKVSQIATFGTMAAKAVVRDVGRVLGYNYGFTDRIAKMIPGTPGITLNQAIEESDALKEEIENNADVAGLIERAKDLEGLTRSVGRHAGGVLISPTKITDYSPLYSDGEGLASQFDKNDVEDAGLVKFDFLGLRNLTVIDWALKSINEKRAQQGLEELKIDEIPMHDEDTYRHIFDNALTTAVFQLESGGMKNLIKKLKPDCFEDLIALVALFRPGPLQSGMVDDFVDRKHGIKEVEYPHPWLEKILKPTYGVIVYQEQVMQIAQVMGGYTLGGADLLRRAMGKKKPEEMAKQREIFVKGALEKGVSEEKATEIFDLMEYFSGYGFNKSHSAAYALISYQTAYLKAHYPSEFMAAVLSSDMDKTDKIIPLIADCQAMDVEILPPDINESVLKFVPQSDGAIRYGLGAVKGVGDKAIENIIEEREANGPYQDFFDFVKRTNSKVNKTAIKGLIYCGALDGFGQSRATLEASMEDAQAYRKGDFGKKKKKRGKKAEQEQQQQVTMDLFGSEIPSAEQAKDAQSHSLDEEGNLKPSYTVKPEWSLKERLEVEAKVMGLYLSGHPMDDYVEEVRPAVTAPIMDLNLDDHGFTTSNKKEVVIVGAITDLSLRKGRGGGKNAFFKLDDKTGLINVALFGKQYKKVSDRVIAGEVVAITGKLEEDTYAGGLKVTPKEINTIAELRERNAKHFVIEADKEDLTPDKITQLKEAFRLHTPGYCKLNLLSVEGDEKQPVNMGNTTVIPSEGLIQAVRNLGLSPQVIYEGAQAESHLKKTAQREGMQAPGQSEDAQRIGAQSPQEVRDSAMARMRVVSNLLNEVRDTRGTGAEQSLSRRVGQKPGKATQSETPANSEQPAAKPERSRGQSFDQPSNKGSSQRLKNLKNSLSSNEP